MGIVLGDFSFVHGRNALATVLGHGCVLVAVFPTVDPMRPWSERRTQTFCPDLTLPPVTDTGLVPNTKTAAR